VLAAGGGDSAAVGSPEGLLAIKVLRSSASRR
jgi:hypothetical protein